MPLLFSYGTLQQPSVQQSTFGRLLDGTADGLPGFVPARVPIADPERAAAAGRTHHDNARFTGRADDRVHGTSFEVTEAELVQADDYERPASYDRMLVTLASGRAAWVYVHMPSIRRARFA